MPNHTTCAVAVCKNRGGTNISYYSFPKDPLISKQWKKKCKRADKFNAANARICSVHFHPDDFERDLRSELLQITPRYIKLKKEAVPTLHLEKVAESKMPSCAIATCDVTFSKGMDITLHSFPKDPNMRKIWLTKCKRADSVNLANARVCSRHFSPDDFERDLRNELLNLPCKKRLKVNAVPTLNLNPASEHKQLTINDNMDYLDSTSYSTTAVEREKRHKAREIRSRALERLKNLPPIEKTKDQETSTDFVDEEKIAMQKRILQLERNLQRSQLRCEELKRQKAADLRKYKLALIEGRHLLKLSQRALMQSQNTVKKKQVNILSPTKSAPKKVKGPNLKHQRKILPAPMKKIPTAVPQNVVTVLPTQKNVIQAASTQNKVLSLVLPAKTNESLIENVPSNTVPARELKFPITFFGNGEHNGPMNILLITSDHKISSVSSS